MMNRIYEKLKDDGRFKDKLKLNEAENCLTIVFNEYITLDYFEGNYTSACDEGLITRRGYAEHIHITEDKEALEVLYDFADGNDIYIENMKKFSLIKIKVTDKEKFEKSGLKEKYMSKKFLRIYSGCSVIKRDE